MSVPLNIIVHYILPMIPQIYVTDVIKLRAVCIASRDIIDSPHTRKFWERYGKTNMPGIPSPRKVLISCKELYERVDDSGHIHFRISSSYNVSQTICEIEHVQLQHPQYNAHGGLLLWGYIYVFFAENQPITNIDYKIRDYRVPCNINFVLWVNPGESTDYIWGYKAHHNVRVWRCQLNCDLGCKTHYY